MTELFDAILKASFQGSIVILAVLALRLLLKNAPKTVFCLLWLLAGLRLVMLFEIQSPFSLQPQLENTNLSIQTQQPVQVPDIQIQNPVGQPLDTPAEPIAPPKLPEGNWENTQTDTLIYGEQGGTVTEPISYGDIAAGIWLLGAAAMLTASAFSYFRLKRRVREAYLIENGCFECPGLDTAFVLGFLPPKIYLPMGLNDAEKKFIFDHENTHIARHDHWFKVLGYVILSIHWFNPLVWVAYGALCRDMELACDEHVVKYMTLPQRKAYSAALLSCGGHTARIAACPVAFGESNPKKRILNVLNYKRPSFWITLLAVIAVVFVGVCLLTSPEKQVEAPEEETKWNLEMQVANVTPSGATVEFLQSGPFAGYDRAELRFGSDYSLEKWTGDNWEPVEMLPQEYDVAWTTEAYLINRNGTTTRKINWEWLYGELPPGRYMLGKSVDLFRGTGDSEINMFWAEFTIEETEPAWTMDMTDEEYLALCRKAVEELQSRAQFHISETLAYFTGETEDSRSDVVFWRDGENWLRQSYVTRMRENRNLLYYDGLLYMQWQKEGEEAVWDLVDSADADREGMTWLHWLQWDSQTVTLEAREQQEDELLVAVVVEGQPPTLGWDNVRAYRILFYFDKSGNLVRTMMSACKENLTALSDLTIEPTLGSNIHKKLENVAAKRPGAPETNLNLTEEEWIEKCRETMVNFWSAPEQYIYVETPGDGTAVVNTYYIAENGWMFTYRQPLQDYVPIRWLCYGEENFRFTGDYDAQNLLTTPYYWQKNRMPQEPPLLPDMSADYWEEKELNFRKAEQENGMEIITLWVSGTGEVYTFHFLQEELLYYDCGRNRYYVRFPYDSTVAEYLDQMYAEASAQAGKKPETPDAAFYEELFNRQLYGANEGDWLYEMFTTFYLNPEEFVRQLSGCNRAEEIIGYMSWNVPDYAPDRFRQVLDELQAANGVDQSIVEKLCQYPLVLGENLIGDQCMEKCRTALESYRSQGSWVILVENSFSGEAVLTENNAQLWYIDGEDWARMSVISNSDFLQENWHLCKDGHCYSRESCTIHNPANGDGFVNGWQDYEDISHWPLPWPVEYDWNSTDIAFMDAGNDGNNEWVRFLIQGSPIPVQELEKVEEYYVTFWFKPAGELWSIQLAYTDTEYAGEKTKVDCTISLYAAAPEEAERMIHQCHQEALRHAQGICDNPKCTDSSHDHSGVNCTDDSCTNATHHHSNHHTDDHHH